MDQVQLKTSVLRILKVNAVLIGVAAFTVVVMGISFMKTHDTNHEMRKFLEVAANIDSNFEDSLSIYTDYIENIINYLLKLRPVNETEFVAFISEVERLGQSLSLNIEIETLEEQSPQKSKSKKEEGSSPTLTYRVSFFGSMVDASNFISKLESMPYFVRVEALNFKTPDYSEKNEQTIQPNVNITIKLYVKTYGTKRS